MINSEESMDRNRYTWNSSIGLLTKKQFSLLMTCSAYGAYLLTEKGHSRSLLEIGLGLFLLFLSFQILIWRNDINNYLLFLTGSPNKGHKKTMNIYGEDVELRNDKDIKLERYLDIYGRTSTKTKKMIGLFFISVISFCIQYFILKEHSLAFYTIAGLGAFMASTSSYGELLIPIFIQFLIVLFKIDEFDKQNLLQLFIYVSLLFLCVSSQYFLESSFLKKYSYDNKFISQSRFKKLMKSVMLLFFIVCVANHFIPGNPNWLKNMFKNDLFGNKSKITTSEKKKKEKSKREPIDSNKQSSHKDYLDKKLQREDLSNLNEKIKDIEKNLELAGNIAKHISTMKGFENIDLSSYVDEFNKKENNMNSQLEGLKNEFNRLKSQRNASQEDLQGLLSKMKNLSLDMKDFKEYSKQFKGSNEEINLPNGTNYQELEEMLNGMNTSLEESKDSINKMIEKNDKQVNEATPEDNSNSTNVEKELLTENQSLSNDKSKKQSKISEEGVDWKRLGTILMCILLFIIIEKFMRVFKSKKIESKSEKRIKKVWTKSLKDLRKKKLSSREEIIQTYGVIHSFLKTKHYIEGGEEAPPALILYRDKVQEIAELEKQFYFITDLFMRCRYGNENIVSKDLKLFRKCVNYSWKRI
jgi:FtsZ-binding cell division protein ZapB